MWHPQFCHWMTEQDPDDGPSYPRWAVIGSVPTPHYSFSLSVHQWTHATDRRSHYGPSYTIVMVVRDPCPKGLQLFLSVFWQTSMTDRHTLDGPSYTTVLVVRDPIPKGLHFFQVFSHGHLRRTFIPTKVCPAQPSSLSRTLVLRVSIFFPSIHWQTSTTDRHTLDD